MVKSSCGKGEGGKLCTGCGSSFRCVHCVSLLASELEGRHAPLARCPLNYQMRKGACLPVCKREAEGLDVVLTNRWGGEAKEHGITHIFAGCLPFRALV